MTNLTGGYVSWHSSPSGTYEVLDGGFWIDGRFYACLPEEDNPYTEAPSDGVVLLVGLDESSIAQVGLRGVGSPQVGERRSMSIGFLVDSEEDYIGFLTAKAMGRPVQFCAGLWTVEVFSALAGESYSLSRPSADSVLPSIPGVSLAPKFLVGGSLADGAGTVTGSRFTSAVNGMVGVYYMPVFLVAFFAVRLALRANNELVVTADLEEVGGSDFG